MDLAITGFGSRLGVKDDCFELSRAMGDQHQHEVVAPTRVRAILLGESALVTTAALKLARENKIDVLVLDGHGDPVGRFWLAGGGSTAAIRRAQLHAAEEELGLATARAWIHHKLGNQRRLLTRLLGRREGLPASCGDAVAAIAAQEATLDPDSAGLDPTAGSTAVLDRPRLFAAEAAAARAFWPAVSSLLPEQWRFEARSRQPARDPFNAALNYGYGLLYGRVAKALAIAGLDIDLGFLHGDRHGKPSLVCDFIEPFRLFADRPVTALFARSRLPDDAFESHEGGIRLAASGRRETVSAVLRYLTARVEHRGRRVAREHVIQLEAHRLAQDLMEGRPPALPAWEV